MLFSDILGSASNTDNSDNKTDNSLKILDKTEGKVVINDSVISLDSDVHAALCRLRPDCNEEAILTVVEQLLLSCGGELKKYIFSSPADGLHNTPVVYQLTQTASTTIWSSICIYFGVSEDAHRAIMIAITPNNASQSKFSSYLSGVSSPQHLEFNSFCFGFISQLFEALKNSLMVWPSEAHSLLPNNDCLPEGVVDICFIRDLQRHFAYRMNTQLTEEVAKLDEAMKNFDLKCARLMTLLKPTYNRASLALSDPPTKVSLNAYPLQLVRGYSIRNANEEENKMMLLRARRSYRDFLQTRSNQRSPSSSSSPALPEPLSSYPVADYDKYYFQVQYLVTDLHQQLLRWMEEEYQVRIQRKMASIKDRVEALSRFKIQLLLTLHDRFQGVEDKATVFGGGWGFSGLSSDRRLQASVAEKFPFIALSEPLLVDTTASVNARKGSFYLTLGHVLFHSTTVLTNGLPSILVIPTKAIGQLQLSLGTKMILSIQFQNSSADAKEQDDNPVAMTTCGTAAAHLTGTDMSSSYPLKIIDFAGVENDFRFHEGTPDYALRIMDLLDLIIRERLFMVIEYQPLQRKQFLASQLQQQQEATDTLADLEGMLKGDTRSSSFTIVEATSKGNTNNSKAKQSGETLSAPPPVGSEEDQLEMLTNFFAESSSTTQASNEKKKKKKEVVVPVQTAPIIVPASTEITSVVAPVADKKPNRLASNIEKFLKKSQKKLDEE